MKAPKDIRISDFTYVLPDEKIAHYPLSNRDASKLLVFNEGDISHHHYKNLHEHLPSGTLLVLNDTKVVQARLHFRKPTGGLVEIFCLEPKGQQDITQAMAQSESVDWTCMVGGAKKWKDGLLHLTLEGSDIDLNVSAEKIEQQKSAYTIRMKWEPSHLSFSEVLDLAGQLPLPPYMNRKAEASDLERYQTVYAKFDGSVAAPTAGLHFTDNVFSSLKENGVEIAHTTLHVGAGTFRPVKAEQMENHDMHFEQIQVDVALLHKLRDQSGPLGAVGTTSLRTLETLYWIGVKLYHKPSLAANELTVTQWEPYELSTDGISSKDAIEAIIKYLKTKNTSQLITKTQLLIAPGYRFRMVDLLVTNFHQPHSTLLLLVAAFAGKEWKAIYDSALSENYRFLSYGDGCLLFRKSEG